MFSKHIEQGKLICILTFHKRYRCFEQPAPGFRGKSTFLVFIFFFFFFFVFFFFLSKLRYISELRREKTRCVRPACPYFGTDLQVYYKNPLKIRCKSVRKIGAIIRSCLKQSNVFFSFSNDPFSFCFQTEKGHTFLYGRLYCQLSVLTSKHKTLRNHKQYL